jgi:hypothetical protein
MGAGKEAADKGADEREFTDPIEEVLARLETLAKQKKDVGCTGRSGT